MNRSLCLPLCLLLAAVALTACADPALDPEAAAPVVEAKRALPYGARVEADAARFAVYSARATAIELWIYDRAFGAEPALVVPMAADGQGAWRATVGRAALAAAGLGDVIHYGYRAWGPNWRYVDDWYPGSEAGFVADVDGEGNRFNPNKLLFDPYGLELSHDPTNAWHVDDTAYATGPRYRAIDTGPFAPKSIAWPDGFTAGDTGPKPTRAFKDDIVYEVHLRGLTMNDPSVPAALRGTYAGAAQKARELAALGVTAVELLPVQETVNDVNDVDPGSTAGDNYWGYMTLSYFAPDRRYAADQSPGGPTREFKAMVRAFHEVGIKVYVDVVYNHTAEGGTFGPTRADTAKSWSMRGLDNVTWYSLTRDRQHFYDNTGTGGNLNTRNPVVQDLIVESLRYWRDELGVDGYRFDLASVLGNTCEHGCFDYDKLDPGTALNRIWRALSPRPAGGGAGVDLIAEPWAIGGNSYQVGNFPAGWIEWGARFRDSLRSDQNELGMAAVTPGEIATRVAGSMDLFGDDGRAPWHSVNFMVAHDGFTLADLYRCNRKRNDQPWPFGPSDGGEDHNRSWDQGGDARAQRRAARNGMALMMLSAGVPMITGGDEWLRSQGCNNNVYNLDSPANWLDWVLDGTERDFRSFTQGLMAFRKRHPALRPAQGYLGVDGNGNVMEQIRWFTPDGSPPSGAYWQDPSMHALAWRIDGTEFGDPAAAIYVAYNGWSGPVEFSLPWPGRQASAWYRVTDTCDWAEGPGQVRAAGSEDRIGGEWSRYRLCGRGLLLLVAK
ncbi:MAG: isoamylase [bacterium]